MKKKILTINFGGLGDQVLFFPALSSLKKVFNDSFITFVTEPRSRSTAKLTDLIDEIYISELKSGNKIISAFKLFVKAVFGRYDMVISSGSSPLIAILLFLTGIKRRIGYDSGALSRMLLTDAVSLNQEQYAANMYHDLVSPLCRAKAELPEIEINLTQESKIAVESLIPSNKLKKIVIHPGVSRLSIEKNIIKYWSAENWAKFIAKLLVTGEYNVILTGGTDDLEIYSRIHYYLTKEDVDRKNLTDLTVKTFGINEFAHIINSSDMLVCVDSAPMHIAVGLKKQVIALFGPTDEKKLLPADELFIPVINNDAACRPCLWQKRQTSCNNMKCLDIEPEQVFNTLIKKLSLIRY